MEFKVAADSIIAEQFHSVQSDIILANAEAIYLHLCSVFDH